MPLVDEALAVLGPAPRDPNVVLRYQAKIVTVPGSECLWWNGAVLGRGHGRFYVGNVADTGASADGLGRVSGSCASSRTGLGTPWCTAHSG